MSKVALIGGAGFIGSHLAVRLKNAGHDVLVLDNFAVNNLLAHLDSDRFDVLSERLGMMKAAGVRMKVLDARDYHAMSLSLGEFRPDALVHLAAVAHVTHANKDPRSTFDHSQRTLENSLDCARNIGIGHLVYLSSSIVYGDFPGGTANEATECRPKGLYGVLKLGNEAVVKAYHDLYGLPFTIVRPIALYGPRCVSGRVIQVWIERAMKGLPLVVKGNGSVTFSHIDDITAGLGLILDHGAANDVFNLAGPGAVSLAHVAELVAAEFGVPVLREPADREMPERGLLEIGKARETFGYVPRVAIEAGVKRYVEWYRGRAGVQPHVVEPAAGEGAAVDWGPDVGREVLEPWRGNRASRDPLHVNGSV